MINTIRTISESKLIALVNTYRGLTGLQKNQMQYVMLRNLLSTNSKLNKAIEDLLDEVSDKLYSVDIEYTIQKFLLNILDYSDEMLGTKIVSIKDILLCCRKNRYLEEKYGDAIFALVTNSILHKSGCCPLIFHSFGQWKRSESEWDIRLLLELSLTYLYRYVEIDALNSCIYADSILLSEGATSIVYLCESGKTICKVPKNFVAANLLIRQEYDNYLHIITTPLKSYIATEYKYCPDSNKLFHRNVVGQSGETMLFNHISFTEEQLASLESFYNTYINRPDKDLILDIHPGNFIWDEYQKRWCLIDIGSIPLIGSGYYEFNDFQSYFDFIWQNREYHIKNTPIRSIDLYIPKNTLS